MVLFACSKNFRTSYVKILIAFLLVWWVEGGVNLLKQWACTQKTWGSWKVTAKHSLLEWNKKQKTYYTLTSTNVKVSALTNIVSHWTKQKQTKKMQCSHWPLNRSNQRLWTKQLMQEPPKPWNQWATKQFLLDTQKYLH